MAIISNTVSYLDGDTLLEGFFAFDDAISGRRPVVLINHTWAGRDEFVKEKAIKLAELGYLGFAVDMYGRGKVGGSVEECSALMQPFIDDRLTIVKRLQAAYAAVRLMPWVDDKQIAMIGFCFGGLCALDFARSGANLKGVVTFHGLLNPPSDSNPASIVAKLLVLHGHDDPMVPVEQIVAFEQEMTKAAVDWQLHTFSQTQHAFTNPKANNPDFGTIYQENSDRRSWILMKNFFEEIFASS